MRTLRSERGNALITAILVVAMMAGLGTAMVSVIDTQTSESRVQRTTDTTFNLAEGALNAEAFLLGRNWPQSTANMPTPAGAASPCSGQSITGTLDPPAASATPSLRDQIQSVLAQTYTGSTTTTGAQWWLTACQDGGKNAWDASLLNGLAYDPTIAADPTPKPRRMWVRAEAKIDGRRRAVAALVQAGQQAVFPSLALVTGNIGDDLGNVLNGLTTGPLLGPITNLLINSDPMVVGNVGLRCSLLDGTDLLGCLSGLLKATSALGPIGALLQANNYTDYNSDSTISADQLALLRQQAQATGTYYATASNGTGGVAAGASCLPGGSAGKIIFIEKVGDGTGSCILNAASNPSAKALIVGSGGVRVCTNGGCAGGGSGTYTGVIYTLHRTDPAYEDVRIENGAKVIGGVYIDDNASLASASRHGSFKVIPPAVTINVLQNNILCWVPLLGNILCGTLNAVLNVLGVNAVLANILPQINPNLPALTYNDTVVKSVTTFGDSAIVPGTFRQLTPMF
jgi:Tfp pilus assembly protein PilX